ncbi:MAG: hypothetical protein RBS68_05035 [Anaerolineales bacterium]|jgi:hypothetical protein|nr:hypothetical protein [Anaerolineales bacterium]
MDNPKAGAQISQKSFIQSLLILFVLMLAAGILTLSTCFDPVTQNEPRPERRPARFCEP